MGRRPGMQTWDYAHCLPYFKRLESCYSGGDAWRGADGPIPLEAYVQHACTRPVSIAPATVTVAPTVHRMYSDARGSVRDAGMSLGMIADGGRLRPPRHTGLP